MSWSMLKPSYKCVGSCPKLKVPRYIAPIILAAGASMLQDISAVHTNPPLENPVMSEPKFWIIVCPYLLSRNISLDRQLMKVSSSCAIANPPNLSDSAIPPSPPPPWKHESEGIQASSVYLLEPKFCTYGVKKLKESSSKELHSDMFLETSKQEVGKLVQFMSETYSTLYYPGQCFAINILSQAVVTYWTFCFYITKPSFIRTTVSLLLPPLCLWSRLCFLCALWSLFAPDRASMASCFGLT